MRKMRAVSLVRAWLYGIRGFVVMTISLAIAFSVAVTGPPTNSEIDVVAEAVSTAALRFGGELEAAALEVCPSLPPELQTLCGAQSAEQSGYENEPSRPSEAAPPPKPPTLVELAPNEALSSAELSASETDLLGGPTLRARNERAQPPRRASTQRASSQRRATTTQRVSSSQRARTQRAVPSRRPSTQRAQSDRGLPERIRAAQQAAQGDLSRGLNTPRRSDSRAQPAPTAETLPAVSRSDESEHLQAEMERAAEDYRRAEDEDRYTSEDESEETWEERRRARRERRARRYEHDYEAPPDDNYEEEAYPEEDYPSDVW